MRNIADATPADDGSVRLTKPASLRERITADLRAQLQGGRISPEDRLVDVDIAAHYGTSRMPVREALMQLVSEGYLVGTTRGFAVPRLSLKDIRDIFEVRRLLEPRAAANAARDLDSEGEVALASALAKARQAAAEDDAEAMIEANVAFRAAWLDAVRNQRLARTIARFVDHVQVVRLDTMRRAETRRVVVEGLEQLFEAFRQRDSVVAADRMTSFMAQAEAAFFATRKAELASDDEPASAQARALRPARRRAS
jgi:DNA-binding GntR family transcriptional regulator